MNYQSYTPHPLLRPYVRCYWSLDQEGDHTPASRERIFPDGCMELLFHYGGLYRKYRQDGSFDHQPRSFLHGQIRRFIDVEAIGPVGIFSIRFRPAGLRPFIPFDIGSLAEQTVELHDLLGRMGGDLEDRILNAATGQQRVAITEAFLLDRLRNAVVQEGPVDYCIRSILASQGNISVVQLAESLRINKHHLSRRFTSEVGLNPKLLSRIVRFQATLRLIDRAGPGTMTQVAHESGFYDQAHFIRDFKEFTGLNPKQYFPEALMMNTFFISA